jgi:cytoskeletal protein CcmA (bactofilin family)
MFNRDALFGKKDEGARSDVRGVNIPPELTKSEPSRAHAAPRTEPPVTVGLREAAAPSAPHAESGGSKLIVGPRIKLKGVEITDCDTLVVEGRVEASMDSRVVQIAESGVYTGSATMDVAEIRGTFEGKLTARKQLVIHATGRVSGEIRYGKVRIEEGGELSGDVSTLPAAEAHPWESAPGHAAPARGAAQEPAARAAKPAARVGTA